MSDTEKDIEQILENIQNGAIGNYPILPPVEPNDDFILEDSLESIKVPLLPLRNIVLFPGMVISVSVQRERSRKLIQWAEKNDAFFAVATQRNGGVENPKITDLYNYGVLARLEGVSEDMEGNINVIIRGYHRIIIESLAASTPYMKVNIIHAPEDAVDAKSTELKAILGMLKDNIIEKYSVLNKPLPPPYLDRIIQEKNIVFITNLAIQIVSVTVKKKQELLTMNSIKERAYQAVLCQQSELEILRVKVQVHEKTRSELDRHNKEYFLQQQMKVLQEELNVGDDEIDELRNKAKTKQWSAEVAATFEKELKKVERLNPQSPDYSVQIQYLNTVLGLPWGIYTEDNFNLKRAERILNAYHYGLEKVKERILEHLAVLMLRGDMKSPIICLYGPPGVGKTSLGKSIAESLGRKYMRISLGGLHDEAEIRGHRRTYVGAMSGRIIQSLGKVGSSNPVFVLDEIDKIGEGSRSNPESALLEVLDPEQNATFHDNYLDIDYDLSKVLFIATANDLSAISRPLRDRMEIIEISGYIEEEKLKIAQKYLIPKALKDHGLDAVEFKFSTKAIELIIEEYTRESGVRQLEKRIAEVMRKIAWRFAQNELCPTEISPECVREYLGKPIFLRERYQSNEHAGVVVGLAWTSVGGDILYIESSLQKGTEGKLTLTGSLGDVMKESAVLALTYIQAHAEELGINPEVFKDKAIHIHVPEGAVPKDGPSAGITMVTSLVSAITRRKVKANLAMTGEITLRGKVLPVGGIKEKILAAKRSGIREIIMCKENEKDVQEIKSTYLKGLSFHFVEDIKEVLEIALTNELAK